MKQSEGERFPLPADCHGPPLSRLAMTLAVRFGDSTLIPSFRNVRVPFALSASKGPDESGGGGGGLVRLCRFARKF